MSDEYRALLQAVLDAPGDDLPRLVYADWLDEHGESERAEFIRVQCEMPQVNNPSTGTEWRELESRSGMILALNWQQWVPGYASWIPAAAPFHHHATFSRGFVSEVRCTLAAWCGGPCGRCGGTGQRLAELIHLGIGPDCPTCGGTGTLVGCGPRIVREHPVEVVRLTDREPRYYGAGYDWITANHERPSSASSAVVPDSLFARLENWLRLTPSGHPMSGKRYRVFTTAELARAELSAALLAWAKSQPVGGA